MCDFLGMQVLDALDDLGEKFSGVVFAEISVFLKPTE